MLKGLISRIKELFEIKEETIMQIYVTPFGTQYICYNDNVYFRVKGESSFILSCMTDEDYLRYIEGGLLTYQTTAIFQFK